MTAPQDYLRDPALSRLYHSTAVGEPPAALDATLIAAARAASAPVGRPRPWWQRLRVPVAVAATAVLAVMLSLTMERHPPVSEEAAPAAPPPTRRPATQPVPATADVANEAAPLPAEARASRRKDQTSPSIRAESPPVSSAYPASSGALSGASRAIPPAATEAAPLAAPAASPSTPSSTAREAATPAAKSLAPRAPAAEGVAADQVGERRDSGKTEAAPAIASGSVGRSLEAVPAPAAWIEQIRNLRRQGRLAEADRQLQDFRAAFPDYYPLPDDLRQPAISPR